MIKHNFKYGHPSVKGSPPLVYTVKEFYICNNFEKKVSVLLYNGIENGIKIFFKIVP